MMGLTIDFSEAVTGYVAGRGKVWRTIGEPQLLIIAGYEMRVLVEPVSPGSHNRSANERVSRGYTRPSQGHETSCMSQ